MQETTHNVLFGYLLWLFGFTGSHRFYYGRPVSGTIYFFTLGLFFIGWLVDLFLIPGLDRQADLRFAAGAKSYNLSWILLTFLGVFGIHRFYLGKLATGLIYFLTGGLLHPNRARHLDQEFLRSSAHKASPPETRRRMAVDPQRRMGRRGTAGAAPLRAEAFARSAIHHDRPTPRGQLEGQRRGMAVV